jgi:hypothetical protein
MLGASARRPSIGLYAKIRNGSLIKLPTRRHGAQSPRIEDDAIEVMPNTVKIVLQ